MQPQAMPIIPYCGSMEPGRLQAWHCFMLARTRWHGVTALSINKHHQLRYCDMTSTSLTVLQFSLVAVPVQGIRRCKSWPLHISLRKAVASCTRADRDIISYLSLSKACKSPCACDTPASKAAPVEYKRGDTKSPIFRSNVASLDVWRIRRAYSWHTSVYLPRVRVPHLWTNLH